VRLTVEEDREAIKRYGHVRPGRARGDGRCAARCPGTARTCTLDKGHRGLHVAHGTFNKVVAVWDAGTELRRPDGRQGESPWALRPFWRRVGGAWSSLGDLALLVMLLGFLAFAVDWFLRIFP
jgi:hypothetical protein